MFDEPFQIQPGNFLPLSEGGIIGESYNEIDEQIRKEIVNERRSRYRERRYNNESV